jgi:hypothetical protein
MGIFEGTFLGEVEDALASGHTNGLELPPLEDGDEVLGEMTPLEQAMFSVLNAKANEIKTTCDACDDTPEDRESDKCKRIQKLKEQAGILKKLSWTMINDRIGAHEINLTLRAGNKIVKLRPEPDLDLGLGGGPDLLRALLGGGRGLRL